MGLLLGPMMDIEVMADWRGFYACEGFYSIISSGLLLLPGGYNHRPKLGNIEGLTFWRKKFTVVTNLVESAWPPRVKHTVEIAM